MTRSTRQRKEAGSRRTLRQNQNGMDSELHTGDSTCPPRDPPGCREEEMIYPRQAFEHYRQGKFVLPGEVQEADGSGHDQAWYEWVYKDVATFCREASGLTLRSYQRDAATRIAESVKGRKGLTFVILFPRQSGKNEIQAQIETYLLAILSQTQAEMIKISPTWKPQTLNAMRRLERVLKRNMITQSMWRKESGYIFRVGDARIFFFSGGPEANIVGATASTLLSIDEAQDIQIAKFDKDIAPMAASTNATRVFWGTAWTSTTLLARELRAARAAQAIDGIRRTFVLTADQVALEVPAYGKFVAEQIAKLGRSHPMVKTQFFSEEIDAEGGMFPPARVALMRGSHHPQPFPYPSADAACLNSAADPAKEPISPDLVYAFTLDLAGEDESATDDFASLSNRRRDSTALTISLVDLATLADPLIKAPSYKVLYRHLWTGTKHTTLYSVIHSIITLWSPRYIVVDATGVGAGLSSFLSSAFPAKVLPFTFTQATKSQLGYDFLALIDSGRFKDYYPPDPHGALFLQQLSLCQYTVLDGPNHTMRWSVPDGTRDPATGELVHDDLILSAALTAVLDAQPWSIPGPVQIVSKPDVILALDKEGF